MGSELILPIRPHLKKYLLRKLNSDENVSVGLNDPIGFGLFVSSHLIKKRNYFMNFHKDQVNQFVTSLSDSIIKLNLKPFHSNHIGMFIDNENVFYINKFINASFTNELFCFIETQKLFYPHINISYAIDDFIGIFSITEDDIPKETLLRNYNRKKEKYSYLK
jgi:hypothetical protein